MGKTNNNRGIWEAQRIYRHAAGNWGDWKHWGKQLKLLWESKTRETKLHTVTKRRGTIKVGQEVIKRREYQILRLHNEAQGRQEV